MAQRFQRTTIAVGGAGALVLKIAFPESEHFTADKAFAAGIVALVVVVPLALWLDIRAARRRKFTGVLTP